MPALGALLGFQFIPLGISLSLYVQAVKTFDSRAGGFATACVAMCAYATGWWLVPWRRRAAHHRAKGPGRPGSP